MTVLLIAVLAFGMTVGPVAGAFAPATADDASSGIEYTGTNADYLGGSGPSQGEASLADAQATIHGLEADDSLGETVAGIGDVSGDGLDDVAVGAPDEGERAGAVHLFFGPVEGDLDASEADLTIAGENEGDWAGTAVDDADLIGDGTPDLVVGAPMYDGDHANGGAVYVFDGAELQRGDGALGLADATVTITGDEAQGWFGQSVAAHAGADGGLLAVGAPGADDERGGAHVYDGLDAGAETLDAADADASFEGDDDGDRTGWAVATVEDYLADGETAVAVGAPNENDAGAVHVLDRAGSVQTTLEGSAADDAAGFALADAGDVDGDDRHDLVVGAPYNDDGTYNGGAVYVHHAATHDDGTTSLADADATFYGVERSEFAGWDVSTAGACAGVQHDGILVGAPGKADDAGAAYVVDGADLADDSSEGHPLSSARTMYVGEEAGDEAGTSVAAAGDVAGDDGPDILVGAPSAHDAAGAAYVLADVCPPLEDVDKEPKGDEPKEEQKEVKEPKEEQKEHKEEEEPREQKEEKEPKEEPKEHEEPKEEEPREQKEEKEPKEEEPEEEPAEVPPQEVDDEEERDEKEEPKEKDDEDEVLQDLLVDSVCKDENGLITVENPNDVPVSVTITGDDFDETYEIGANDELTTSELHDGTYQLSSEDVELDRTTVEIECPDDDGEPGVDLDELLVTDECVDGFGAITVDNPNDGPVNVTVSADEYDETVTIKAGEDATFGDLENDTYSLSAQADGESVALDRTSVTIDCDDDDGEPDEFEPVGEYLSCEQFRVTSFDNATSVTLEFQDGTDATYQVSEQMLEEDDWVFPQEGDENEGKTIVSATIERDGESATFDQTNDCEDDGSDEFEPVGNYLSCTEFYVTDFDNATSVTLTFQDETSQTIEIDQNMLGQGEWTFLGTGEHEGKTIVSAELERNGQSVTIGQTNDCPADEELDELLVTDECVEGFGAITVDNPNDVPVNVTVSGDGYDEMVTIAAGEDATFADLENDTYSLSAEADGESVALDRTSVTIGCADDEPEPGQHAISFIAFCFADDADATVTLTSMDDSNDPMQIGFEVEGDMPSEIVHKTGGGDDALYQQSGTSGGTVIAGDGTDVGNDRSPSTPCPAGTTELKFEDGDLSQGAALTVGEPAEPAFFDVSNLNAPGEVEEGQEFDVTAEIENTGDEPGTQTVEFTIDGNVEDSQEVTLGGDESQTVSFTGVSIDNADSYTLAVASEDDSDSTTISVQEPANPAFFTVEITGTNSPVTLGNTLSVDADIENTGGEQGTQTIELTIDGDVKDSQSVDLASGEDTSITLEWDTNPGHDDDGDYNATISSEDDQDEEEIEIESIGGGPSALTTTENGEEQEEQEEQERIVLLL